MRTSYHARTAVLVLLPLLIAAPSSAHEGKAVAGTEPAGVETHQEAMEPTEVVAAFHAALASGDGDAALALMAPAVVILESGGGEKSRDEYASHHLGGDMRFAASSTREMLEQRQETFGDTAVVLTWTRTTGSVGEREIDSNGVETMVLHRADGQWRIVHVHWSSRSNRR